MLRLRFLLTFALVFSGGLSCCVAAEVSGTLLQWHTLTLTFDGPIESERAELSPFSRYALTVWFIQGETSERYEVPGFFAADGNAAETSAIEGNRWRVRFSPSLTGKWTYRAILKRDGALVPLEGANGEFTEVAGTGSCRQR